MSIVENKLKNMIKTSGALKKERAIVIAVSGGVDSMALTSLMKSLQEEYLLKIYVVHVQHHLRGKEAERYAKLVEKYSLENGLEYIRKDVDVKALVKKEGLSVEEAARILRHKALVEVREETHALAIFLAHHLDDQGETILLNLLRGTGTKGLRGMLPVNGFLVRPLLWATKEDLTKYCTEKKIPYCFDSTNNDTAYKRNWVRKNLMPLLKTVNPQIEKSLAITATLAARDNEALDEESFKYLKKHGSIEGEKFVLVVKTLKRKPIAIQNRVVKMALRKVAPENYDFDHIEGVRGLITKGDSGKSLELPKIKVLYGYDKIEVSLQRKKKTNKKIEIKVNIPGINNLPEGKNLKTQLVRAKGKNEENVFYYPQELLKETLYIRNRQLGDTFRPSGAGGKKLKDFLIDKKIPSADRDNLLVLAQGKKVLWILGVRKASWKEEVKKSSYIKFTLGEDSSNG